MACNFFQKDAKLDSFEYNFTNYIVDTRLKEPYALELVWKLEVVEDKLFNYSTPVNVFSLLPGEERTFQFNSLTSSSSGQTSNSNSSLLTTSDTEVQVTNNFSNYLVNSSQNYSKTDTEGGGGGGFELDLGIFSIGGDGGYDTQSTTTTFEKELNKALSYSSTKTNQQNSRQQFTEVSSSSFNYQSQSASTGLTRTFKNESTQKIATYTFHNILKTYTATLSLKEVNGWYKPQAGTSFGANYTPNTFITFTKNNFRLSSKDEQEIIKSFDREASANGSSNTPTTVNPGLVNSLSNNIANITNTRIAATVNPLTRYYNYLEEIKDTWEKKIGKFLTKKMHVRTAGYLIRGENNCDLLSDEFQLKVLDNENELNVIETKARLNPTPTDD